MDPTESLQHTKLTTDPTTTTTKYVIKKQKKSLVYCSLPKQIEVKQTYQGKKVIVAKEREEEDSSRQENSSSGNSNNNGNSSNINTTLKSSDLSQSLLNMKDSNGNVKPSTILGDINQYIELKRKYNKLQRQTVKSSRDMKSVTIKIPMIAAISPRIKSISITEPVLSPTLSSREIKSFTSISPGRSLVPTSPKKPSISFNASLSPRSVYSAYSNYPVSLQSDHLNEDDLSDDELDESQKREKLLKEVIKRRELERTQVKDNLNKMSVVDRLIATHDERVMKKWEANNQAWSKMEQKLAKAVGKDPSELTLNRGNLYRERIEENVLLDKATPMHMKYGPEYWKMSLRDNSDYTVPIGNIFSGLFCPIKQQDSVPPEIIRRPVIQKLGQTRTWKTSEFLKKRQNFLNKKLHELRPYNLDEIETLEIVGRDMFEDDLSMPKYSYLNEQTSLPDMPEKEDDLESDEAGDIANQTAANESINHPVSIRASTNSISIETIPGKIACGFVDLTNDGLSAIHVHLELEQIHNTFSLNNSYLLLPHTTKRVNVTFCSGSPGVFLGKIALHSTPALHTPLIIIVMAFCMDLINHDKERSELRSRLNSIAKEIHDEPPTFHSPVGPFLCTLNKSNDEVRVEFLNKNAGYSTRLFFYHDHIIELDNLYAEVMKLYKKAIRNVAIWDYSIATLEEAIDNIPVGKRPIYSGGARDEAGIHKEREHQISLRTKLQLIIEKMSIRPLPNELFANIFKSTLSDLSISIPIIAEKLRELAVPVKIPDSEEFEPVTIKKELTKYVRELILNKIESFEHLCNDARLRKQPSKNSKLLSWSIKQSNSIVDYPIETATSCSFATSNSLENFYVINKHVYSWKEGDSLNESVPIPQLVNICFHIPVKSISIGTKLSYLVTEIGDVYSTDFHNSVDLILKGKSIVSVVSSFSSTPAAHALLDSDFAIALSSDGKVYSWGSNGSGELGRNGSHEPEAIIFENQIFQVACGSSHAFALDINGSLFHWGRQLGFSFIVDPKDKDDKTKEKITKALSTASTMLPTKVSIGEERIVTIAACSTSNFAVSEGGILYGWGKSFGGIELTDVPSVLTIIPGLVKYISFTNNYGLICNTDNIIYECGINNEPNIISIDSSIIESKNITSVSSGNSKSFIFMH